MAAFVLTANMRLCLCVVICAVLLLLSDMN